jgi:hypothetical protein
MEKVIFFRHLLDTQALGHQPGHRVNKKVFFKRPSDGRLVQRYFCKDCKKHFVFAVAAAYATVKVGNGGDVLDSFLDQLRYLLGQVVTTARPNKPFWQQCFKRERLNAEQRSLC